MQTASAPGCGSHVGGTRRFTCSVTSVNSPRPVPFDGPLQQTRSAALANTQFGVEIPKSRIAARFASGLVLRNIRCLRLTMSDRCRKRPADTRGCGRRRDRDGGIGPRWRILRRHKADLACEQQSCARTNDPFARLMHHTPRLLASSARVVTGTLFWRRDLHLRRLLVPELICDDAAFTVARRRRQPLQPGSQPVHNT
jgi:hypothetical protein